ncbi:MAG: hypothetical protein QW117_00230 [Candidatus Pacearchaeota archaeon]
MILTLYHNYEEDIIDIEEISKFIKEKYNISLKIKQFKPLNKYIQPFSAITEIRIEENIGNGKLEEILSYIESKIR